MPVETFRDVAPGVRLYERRIGTGPEVVVLHGGPGAHHDYLLPGFDHLAGRRTLVYYDQRGGGRSAVARDVPVSWREQVADLESLRRIWGLERLAIAGYSWGGLLALLYALEHPAAVSHLALVSAAPCWRGGRGEFEARFAARSSAPAVLAMRAAAEASGLRERDPAAWRQRMFELSVAGYFHDPTMVTALTPFRITGRTQQEVWESLGEYDLRLRLGGIAVPAIVVHGDADPIPVEAARVLAEGLGAPLHVLPDCGHVPYVEAVDEFTRILDGFLPGRTDG